MQITWALRISASNCSRCSGRAELSVICIVTFSGVTSGGMVTSGTRCCTLNMIFIYNVNNYFLMLGVNYRFHFKSLTLGMNTSFISDVIRVLFPTPSIISICVWVWMCVYIEIVFYTLKKINCWVPLVGIDNKNSRTYRLLQVKCVRHVA